MGINNVAGVENWARFHAGNPGCDRLGELLDEYDRRGAELAERDVRLARIASEHRSTITDCCKSCNACAECDFPWPCDTYKLATGSGDG
jgi:hypothetical protein